MSEECFKIKKTVFPKCKTEVIFSEGLNIVTGDYDSNVQWGASDLAVLDEKYDILFWKDLYASNMHPTYLRMEAGDIIQNVAEGRQAIIFTYSLFLIRELDLLANANQMPIRYINLYCDKGEWKIEQSESIEDINHLSLLDEHLAQSDRYLRA